MLTGVTSQKGAVVGFCKHYNELRFRMSNCKLLRITLLHGVGIVSVCLFGVVLLDFLIKV